MKKLFTAVFLFSISFFVSQAQQASRLGAASRCATQEEFMKHVQEDPSLLERKEQFDRMVNEVIQNGLSPDQAVLKVVPVVVHVLHDCGAGNISKEQILDGIRILNEDFRRQNADTSSTPTPFRTIAADAEVEFRLAKIDPFGNCTDGIVRVETNRTNLWNPRDSLKNVSHWPSQKYLNIWLVNTIYDQNGGGAGTILGYAQFPWDLSSKPSTDGVVIRHDYFGSIGTASGSGNAGRVATHEVGHWLGLLHIWGDDNGQCTGSDQCNDTPNSADQVFGCPNFPLNDACNATPNGIMFMNYMDYTDGICQNIFTTNQKTRMDNAFGAYRNIVRSTSNLNATGVNGQPTVTCAPIAAICSGNTYYTCAGGNVTFNNFTYNADTITYLWNCPGGTPATSTDMNPTITYNTPGSYNISMVATTSGGSDSVLYTNRVIVSGPASITPITTSTMEDFELASSFPADGFVVNHDNSYTWQRITTSGYSGVASIRIDNYNNVRGEIDEYITPSFDFQYLVGPQMKFRRANAQRTATSNDLLNVYVSTNCGTTWVNRKTLAGSALATAGVVGSPYTPSAPAQWVLTTVNPSTSGANNVRFKFENISDAGNNLYIDDINITAISVVGIEETEFESKGFRVYPNPASGTATVTYQLASTGDITLSLLDVTGREVRSLLNDKKETGIHLLNLDVSTLSKGLYFLNLRTPNSDITTRFIVE